MPPSRDVKAINFARVVRRALDDARAQGLTDLDIQGRTGIPFGTFHRWTRPKDFGRNGPRPDKVRQFFERLGWPAKPAFDALGWGDDQKPQPPPAPELPADVKEILRRLRDPNVPDREKEFIAETLKSLIARRPARTAK